MGLGRLAMAWLLVFFSSAQAEAYLQLKTQSGLPVRWTNRPARYNLAGNPTNRSGISADDFKNSVARTLNRWTEASKGSIESRYWQADRGEAFVSNSDYDGYSKIYFASGAGTKMDPGVLGLTQVWYDANTGEVLESDVALNDRDFKLTLEPRDSISATGKAFLENILAHEFGHALGLAHTAGLQATMFYEEFKHESRLSCDELAAIGAIYPGGAQKTRGAIRGSVTYEGAPVHGAHVLAISRSRGVVLATALTDKDGAYRIGGLESGSYYLMAETFHGGSGVLPESQSGIKPNVCPGGATFARAFARDSSGQASSVNVEAGQDASAPAIQVACSLRLPEATEMDGRLVRAASTSTAPSNRYTFVHTGGRMTLRALAHTLFSPVALAWKVFGPDGHEVTQDASDAAGPSTAQVSGYRNRDSSLVWTSLPAGTYSLEYESSTLSRSSFPGASSAQQKNPFAFLSVESGTAEPSAPEDFPVHPRCEAPEPTTAAAYAAPAGDPPKGTYAPAKDVIQSLFAGCAPARNAHADSGATSSSRVWESLLSCAAQWLVFAGIWATFRRPRRLLRPVKGPGTLSSR